MARLQRRTELLMGNIGTAGRVALTKRAGVASSATPSPALDWTPTLYVASEAACQDYSEERVQGITQTITLALSVSSTLGSYPPSVYFRKSSTSNSTFGAYCGPTLVFAGSYSSPIPEGSSSTLGFSQAYNGTTLLISSLTASNDDYIAFVATDNAPPFPPSGTSTVTIQIRNSSDGNALLDTITFQQDA
jgi:hypothetical protein